MIKTLLLTVFIASLSVTLFAQKNFIPGYVIQNSGDTLVGLVNYKASKKIATQCEFQKNKGEKVSIYTPESAAGYGFVNGSQFTVKNVPTDSGKTEKVFLEILIRGKVSLYRYVHEFLIEKDKLYPLEIQTVMLNSNAVKDGLEGTGQSMDYEQKKKTYVGILNYLFIDCPEISKEVSKVNLDEGSLIKITEKYNQCVGAEHVVLKKKGKGLKIDVLGAVGLNSSLLSFTTPYITKFKSPSDRSISPTFSLGLQFNNSSQNENISASAEIQFSKEVFSESGSSTEIYYYNYDYNLQYSRIKIPVGLKYKFFTGKVTPYVRVGAGFNFYMNGNLKTTEKRTTLSPPQNTSETKTDANITGLRTLEFWGSSGIQMSLGKVRAYLEIKGHFAAGMANNGVYTEGPGKTLVIDPKSVHSNDLGVQLGFFF